MDGEEGDTYSPRNTMFKELLEYGDHKAQAGSFYNGISEDLFATSVQVGIFLIIEHRP